MSKELYVSLPAEDQQEKSEDTVGTLIKNMYGTQDASPIWEPVYAKLICGKLGGFRRGIHSAALLHIEDGSARWWLCVCQTKTDSIAQGKNTANDMETRGFEDCDANRLLLDRFLEIESFMETRANDCQGIWTHSEHQSQRTYTPREELQDKFVLDGRKNPILKKEDAMLNRSVSVRLACLTQDRLDLAETAQHLAQRMSEQRETDCVPLKCATRYRVGKPNDAIRCRRQGGC